MERKTGLSIYTLILTLLLGSAQQLLACWCNAPNSCEATNRASAVFVGKVLKVESREKPEDGGRRTSWKERITFQVKENFLGAKDKIVEIDTGTEFGPGDCNYFPFKKDEIYLVYAYHDEESGALSVGECGGTKSLTKAADDLKYLRNIPRGNRNGKILGSVFGFGFDPGLNRFDDMTLAGIPLLLTGNGVSKTILTDDQGDYEVSGLKAGKYQLQVYLPEIYELLSSGKDDSAREIDLNGKGCVRESFFPDIKNVLEGTVKDRDGQPLENIEVLLIPETKQDENDTRNNYTEFTDKNGKFTFSNIFPRRYLLGINIEEAEVDEADEVEPQKIFYPNTLTRSEALKIEFGLGKKLSGFDLIWNQDK